MPTVRIIKTRLLYLPLHHALFVFSYVSFAPFLNVVC